MNISIVVISYNSGKFLERNLYSIVEQTHRFHQIIIVENASTDGSLEIAGRFDHQPNLEILAMTDNLGYAGGANAGINHTDSDLVLVANSDIILDKRFNERVVRKFEENKKIDLLSPLILRFDKKTVDSAGQACSRTLHPAEIGYNQPLKDVEITEKPVFSVCGAATVFARNALERLKMDGQFYDEDFFIFWEDFDIGWRAQLLGMNVLFYPEAVVYHYRSATLEHNFISRFSLALARPRFIKYHLVKNRYLTLIKNFRLKNDALRLPFVFLKDLIWVPMLTFSSPKIIIDLMKSGRFFRGAAKKRKELKLRERSKQTPRQ